MPEIYDQFVDSPGFFDTKGISQEVINSYANAVMFRKGSKVKIILMIEESAITSGRGKTLIETGNKLYELFQNDFTHVVHSIIFVFSKISIQSDSM